MWVYDRCGGTVIIPHIKQITYFLSSDSVASAGKRFRKYALKQNGIRIGRNNWRRTMYMYLRDFLVVSESVQKNNAIRVGAYANAKIPHSRKWVALVFSSE